MLLLRFAMRRPISILVFVFSLALLGFVAAQKMHRDILPDMGVPVIYIAQPYGGMDASQMEGYLTYYYEYHFLFIPGVEQMESKNIHGSAIIKLQFHPGTDMSEALAQTINYANRARAYMPAGTLPPFIMRFDAGTQPVGDLVLTSPTRTLGQLQDYALNVVRPLFATLPGVSAPAPFGASQRAVVIRADPEKLRRFNLSPYDVAEAVNDANKVVASGNITVGNLYPTVPLNSVVKDIKELEEIPLRTGTYPTVFLKDVATVDDGTDIQTGYALVNGRRAVYIPVTKRSDASTLSVVNLVKSNMDRFQAVLPNDVKISYEFDQSGSVKRAIASLLEEGILGALLTGLMVAFFFKDWRSALIVVFSIPVALMAALAALWFSGQTINVMTLGGLSLAIGILVDEVTVVMENIHTHLATGKKIAGAVMDATSEIILPGLLTMICVLAVFIPALFMGGVSKALFVPLSLAVGFSILASFILSMTFIPVISTKWLSHFQGLKQVEKDAKSRLRHFQNLYKSVLERAMGFRKSLLGVYFVVAAVLILLLSHAIGREIFPHIDLGQFQFRLRAPAGTSIETTEGYMLKALDLIKTEVGPSNVESSVGFVGTQPPSFPMNAVYLWTSGPQEGVLEVSLKKGTGIRLADLTEKLRDSFHRNLPSVQVSFEASGIINRIMSQGSPTPIEILVSGPNFEANRQFAEKIKSSLMDIPELRDVQYNQVFEYPTIGVNVQRRHAGLLGLTVDKIGRALTPATSSSRYILRTFWADPKTGIAHQIQVQVQNNKMASAEDVKNLPVSLNGGAVPLKDVADVIQTQEIGEYDHNNMQRTVTLTANIAGDDLGLAARKIEERLQRLAGQRPAGLTASLRGQVAPMLEMFQSLQVGLAVAVLVIFLLLAANFESLNLSLAVLSTIPAVITGVGLMLFLTGTTLNVESFMGTIMAVGVAVANSILLVTFAERARVAGASAVQAAVEGARSRLRPIVMTSSAMIVGMIPMAAGWAEGSQQTAPLGRAVIGGMAMSTLATLFILPAVYSLLQTRKAAHSNSLDPDDPRSAHFRSQG